MTAPVPSAISDALRREQVRAVGTRFLRQRPLVALVGGPVNAALLHASGAPFAQRAWVTGCLAFLLSLFVAEAALLRTRSVTTTWLFASLCLTAVVLASACALTGGAHSPMFPLLFAPIGVGFAAFGRGRTAGVWVVLSLFTFAGLLVLPESASFRRVPPPYDGAMTVVSATVAVVLLRIGVAGLTDAHARAAETMDRLRAGTLAEASARAREAEAVGAKVAHELKNPLAAIKGLLQLLSRRVSDERDAKRCDVALTEIDRMHATLEAYLTFTKPLRDVQFSLLRLDQLVSEIADFIEPAAAGQGVSVRCAVEPVSAMGDAGRIRDALFNLAENALAALRGGGVLEITLTREASRAVLRVRDDGVGMTEDVLADAGTPFASHREGGTGLGLALVRGVARQHGGDLTIESAPGRGTTVTLHLSTLVDAA